MTLSTRAAAPVTLPGVTITRGLAYVTDGHPRQCLDLYAPFHASGPLPVIVWLHGGDVLGDSQTSVRAALPFVADGYAVVRLDYRSLTTLAAVHDAKAAVRWLRAHAEDYGLDGGRIGVWGESTGGRLAALLGTSGDVADLEGDLGHAEQSSRVQAVVDFYGLADCGTLDALKYVSAGAPPFMIMHGNQDQHVAVGKAERLARALAAAEVDMSFHVIPGAGHGDPVFSGIGIRRLVAEFFAEHLAPG